jgi:large subunit ribosomal protein L22
MIAKAVAKYAKISPRKARLITCLIKGKNARQAIGILNVSNKKASGMIMKLLKSAIANAKRFPNVNENELSISDIYVDGGPVSKRFRAEALGRASVLRKPTSHITVVLDIEKIKDKTLPKKTKIKIDKAKVAKARKSRERKNSTNSRINLRRKKSGS